MKKSNSYRLHLIIFGFVIAFLLLTVRLFYWQVLHTKEFKAYGALQSTESLNVASKRGEIFSSDGYALASNKLEYLLYANPRVIDKKTEYAEKLSKVLDIDEATISAQLDKELFWVKIANRLNEKEKQAVENLKLEGLGFEQENLRFYPEASMAAHLVGFLGKDELGNQQGYFGIEGLYNEQLEGRPGRLYVVKDALGNPVINDIREEKRINGRDLTLTIDRTIQFIAEKKLKEGVKKYEAQGGSVIIMEPSTGKVLAMASVPNFDAQTYWEFDPASYVNPVISKLYEPGSTFKVLVMAAALDLGVIKPDTQCTICAGPVKIGEYEIKTWNNKYYANTTMTEVIQHSDNTGMVFVGRKMGLDNLIQYFKKFGIGEKTGIDLQGEVTGEIRDRDSWYPIDLATATFGQGISVTPMQLVTGVAAIANGGNMVKPYVVDKIETDEGKVITTEPEIRGRAIKETTAKVMTWIMVNSVDKGESKWTRLDGYKVAGKTGTAQIPVEGHYDPRNTIASFVGFFPADEPKITMLVLVNRPKTSIYGSETAAPIFFSIAREIVNYYNIPPSY